MESWKENILHAASSLWSKLVEFVPNILGTILILILGFILAKFLRKIVGQGLQKIGFDTLGDKTGIHDNFEKMGIKHKLSHIFGAVVYWVIILVFLISASESLKLSKVSEAIYQLVNYVPHVVGAALIFMFGLMMANFLGKMVENASAQTGFEYSSVIGKMISVIMTIVVGVLAIGQLQVETELLRKVIEIVLITAGVAFALSMGLGSRGVSKNILSGVYAKEMFKPGDKIQFENLVGVVVEVGMLNISIQNEDGQIILIPNSKVYENIWTKL